MAVLLSFEGKAANSQEWGFYCEEYCKYNNVCNKKNKPLQLQSTQRALEVHQALKHHDFDYFKMPYRTNQLVAIVDRLETIEKRK